MTAKKKTEEVIVRSVRYNGRSIKCDWEQGGDPCSRTYHDNPLPAFIKALESLRAHVCSLCELPAKDEEKITVIGISLRPLGDDNQQGVIFAKKKLRKGKRAFKFSTPLLALWEPKEKEDKLKTDSMDEDTAKAMTKVESETKKYICGDRAQGKLELEGEDDDEEEKPDNQTEFPPLTEPAKT